MSYHFFSIRAVDATADEAHLNAFLAAHRVVALHWQWIDQGLESRWVVRVEVASGVGPLPASLKREGGGASKSKEAIDYREIMPRPARRRLAQQRQERALGLPERQPPGQRQPQPGLSAPPELPESAFQNERGSGHAERRSKTPSRGCATTQGPDRRPARDARPCSASRRTARPLGVLVGAVDSARTLPGGPPHSMARRIALAEGSHGLFAAARSPEAAWPRLLRAPAPLPDAEAGDKGRWRVSRPVVTTGPVPGSGRQRGWRR